MTNSKGSVLVGGQGSLLGTFGRRPEIDPLIAAYRLGGIVAPPRTVAVWWTAAV